MTPIPNYILTIGDIDIAALDAHQEITHRTADHARLAARVVRCCEQALDGGFGEPWRGVGHMRASCLASLQTASSAHIA